MQYAMEGIRVFGVGIGIVILVVIWALVLISCVISTSGYGLSVGISIVVFLIASIITAVLVSIPHYPEGEVTISEVHKYDSYFILRLCMLIMMIISFFGAFVSLLVTYWSEEIRAQPLKKQRTA